MGEGTIAPMPDAPANPPLETELHRLEEQLDELLAIVARLQEENRALRNRQDALAGERATLLQKNEQARVRVEAIIGRLRTMEAGT